MNTLPKKLGGGVTIVTIIIVVVVVGYFIYTMVLDKKINRLSKLPGQELSQQIKQNIEPSTVNELVNLDITDEQLLVKKESNAIYNNTMTMGETIINEKNIFDPVQFTEVAMSPFMIQENPNSLQAMSGYVK